MELLFVALGSILIGLGLRYLLPGRHAYGSALLPAVSAIVASAVWAGLTWLGWHFDGGWIWWASLIAGGLASIALALILVPRRKQIDELTLQKLTRPQASN
ncbi:MAG: hypothetical protein IT191_01925 [Microbacteriaceae bacterium]|nr:hypothetical protein [Cryobacterium sp.]MBX3104163.1 hypothetical protein [Cryobacterium sp.]MCC6375758.1 hypothetical protein [Microbacteriaceae bacterium]